MTPHRCKTPGLLRRRQLGITPNDGRVWRCECGRSWRFISHGYLDDRKWVRAFRDTSNPSDVGANSPESEIPPSGSGARP